VHSCRWNKNLGNKLWWWNIIGKGIRKHRIITFQVSLGPAPQLLLLMLLMFLTVNIPAFTAFSCQGSFSTVIKSWLEQHWAHWLQLYSGLRNCERKEIVKFCQCRNVSDAACQQYRIYFARELTVLSNGFFPCCLCVFLSTYQKDKVEIIVGMWKNCWGELLSKKFL